MTETDSDITSPQDLLTPHSDRVFRSKNSRFFHRQHCSQGREIHEKNRVYYSNADVAKFDGLKPCSICSVTFFNAITKLLK